MKKRHAVQIDYDRFLDPRIISLEQVGSREVELEIEKLKADGLTLVEVAGYPVLVPPEHIIQAAEEAASSTFYPPSNGLLELREALARAIAGQYEITVDAESEILIT